MHHFPEFIVSLRGGDVLWVKVHHFKQVHFCPCEDSGENQRHQDLVQAPGYWKTCLKLEKMAEK